MSWRRWLVVPVGAMLSIGVGLATASYAVGSVDPVYHDGYRQPVTVAHRAPAPIEDWRGEAAGPSEGIAYVEPAPVYRPAVQEMRPRDDEAVTASSEGMSATVSTHTVSTETVTTDEPVAEVSPSI